VGAGHAIAESPTLRHTGTGREIMPDLASKTCVPCRGDTPAIKGKDLERLMQQVPEWKVVNEAAGASPRYFPGLGQGRSHFVDAQDRWAERKRLHHGGQDRSAERLTQDDYGAFGLGWT
jgi:hypothetical protein